MGESPADEIVANPEHKLRFWGCQNPYGIMAVCMPCGYHELLGDGLTLEVITERTEEHQAAADGLRVRIHQHLRKYPLLTVHEIGRALKASDASVRRRLQALQEDGEANPETGPKCEGDPRPVTRWTAT